MERVGHQLLAGAAGAADQDRHVGVGDAIDGLEQPVHGRAGPDDVLEPVRLAHLLEEPAMVAAEQYAFNHAPHDDAQLVVVEGLGHVVRRAQLHRLHRGLLRAVRGDHDDGQVGIERAGALEDLHAAHPVHAEIGDDQMEAAGLDPA